MDTQNSHYSLNLFIILGFPKEFAVYPKEFAVYTDVGLCRRMYSSYFKAQGLY